MAKNAVRVVVDELDRFIDDVMKKIALDLVAILAAAPSEGGTPIDTGWASANWVPYLGSPPSAPAGSRPKNSAHGANNASRSAQQSGIATAATKFKHKQHKLGVNNAVPYIIDLNDGGSKQAGSAFVQKAMNRVVRNFRKELKLTADVGPNRQSSGIGF